MNLLILVLFATFRGQTAGRSEFETGRTFYADGEFKKAAAHFQLALKTNPNDAETHYWAGMSYQVLADIAAPFDGKYHAKARAYLTRATDLAPDRPEYRRELFDFLLESTRDSRSALRQAAGILRTTPESDPDYNDMRRRFQRESKLASSAQAQLGNLFLAAPRAAVQIAELPASR
jgi:tetratricopeptide (TPR) repeat protein